MNIFKMNATVTVGVFIAIACTFYIAFVRPLTMSREAGVRLLLEHRAWKIHEMLHEHKNGSHGQGEIVAFDDNWRVVLHRSKQRPDIAVEHAKVGDALKSMPHEYRLNDGDQLTPYYFIRTVANMGSDRPIYLTDSHGNPVIAIIPSLLTDWRDNPDITLEDILSHSSGGAAVYLSYADHSFYKLDSTMLSRSKLHRTDAAK